jgi:LuxR family maltose regulon positive regulatory protein
VVVSLRGGRGPAMLTAMSSRRLAAALSPPPRVRPPRPPGDAVSRPRLLERLDEGDGLLTVVVAPAGFGKTTLLAEWASARPGVAWLSLDAADADPAALWAHVAAALRRWASGDDEDGEDVEPTPVAVAQLAELLAPAALVLDGYERIVGSAADASLWELAQECPSFQLVVSGRSEPSLPLAAPRARGGLLELRTADLRLTDVEASAFVERLAGGALPPASTAELVARCDGWAAALRLAVRESVESGWKAQLRDLVVGEILAGRDEERVFLTRTSILGELSGPLCDAVLAADGSEAMLARLERDNLLVERSGAEGRYRLERAAREALRLELARTEAASVLDLHRRAAAWYAAAGEREEEIEHLLAGGETAAAATRVARSWPAVVDGGGRERVLRWLEQLPPSETDVRLALARGWVLRLDGRRDESDVWLDAARTAVPLRARRAVVRGCVLARAAFPWDDVELGLTLARRAWRSERHGPRRAVAAWALGWASWWSGSLDAAAAALADALAGPLLVRIASETVLARIELGRGNVDRAAELVELASTAAGEHRLGGLPELGLVATALGALAAARGDRAAALEPLERGVRLSRSWGHPLGAADALLVAAPVTAVERGRRAAADQLDEARRLLAACPDPGARLRAQLVAAARAALPRPVGAVRNAELTPRERAVLHLLAQGRSKREIAGELSVSFNTVHSHTKAIYRKLGASSRREAVERVAEIGL